MGDKRTLNEKSQILPQPSSSGNMGSYVLITDTRTSGPVWSSMVEVVALIFFFSKILSDSLVTNFLEYVTCRTVYNYNESMCVEPMSENIEDLVQPTVANIIMLRTFTESLIPSLFVLFVGPWSDVNGRKTFLMVSLAGLSCSYALWGVLSSITGLRPEIFLLSSVPVIFTGGTCTVFMSFFCYVCDVTTIEDRALRMAVFQFIFYIGIIFGTMSAPKMLISINNLPYTAVFMVSSAFMMIAVIYVWLCISESVIIQEGRQRKLLDLDHVRELFAVCFLKRSHHARAMIMLAAISLALTVFITQGENGVVYLSLRELFGWQLEHFAFYSSCSLVFNSVGSLVGVWLFITVLNFPVMPMAVAVTFCRIIQSVINATASSGFYFYISSAIGSLLFMLGSLVRLEISKLMPQQDLGKIMAFISFLEFICPIIAAPMYTFLYDATYSTHPESIYWLSSVLSLLPVGFLLTVVFLQYTQHNFRYTGMDPLEVQ